MTVSNNQLSLLEWAREIGREYPFLDFHVHPFDVLTGDINYRPDERAEGLFTKSSLAYHPPCLEDGKATAQSSSAFQTRTTSQSAFLLASRLAYTHTGPRVFADQIDLIGITSALLLPVARIPGAAQEMLNAATHMFGTDHRLLLGCPFPVGLPPEDVSLFFRSAYETMNIRAIKLHPNLAQIDPLTKVGQNLMEATLEVASSLGLPVIVHGGFTPGLEPPESREFGTLPHLVNVDWSISFAPVIIAHAGCYGLTIDEADTAIPMLERLFDKFPNLLADTSNINPLVLKILLAKVDRNRFVFGSDALYIPMWKAWIQFLKTLRIVSLHPDKDLIRIASLNPTYCLRLQPV